MKSVRFPRTGMVIVFPLVVVVGCPGVSPDDMSMAPSSPSAAKLFTMITETDPYEAWAQFPEVEGIIESAAPHGPMARIFINSIVEAALNDFTGRLPVGSVIVKENLGESTSEKADALTIMWKVEGFDPGNNDWFWTNVTPSGNVNAEGSIEGCLSCHSGSRDNDFVFVHQFSSE